MKLGFFQFDPVFGKIEENLNTLAEGLSGFQGPGLIVLPELFATGYQFVSTDEVETLAEEIPEGPTSRFLIHLARKHRVAIVGGLPERGEMGLLFNSAVLAGPQGYVGRYRKIHLFFEEKDFFSPGNEEFRVYDVDGMRIGMLICFDWIFPESARILALKGADVLAHPANLVLPFCQKAMVTRSIENGVFTITANRYGSEERGGKKKMTFTGQSQVTSPKGKVLLSVKEKEKGPFWVEEEPSQARSKWVTEKNHLLQDRRPEWY